MTAQAALAIDMAPLVGRPLLYALSVSAILLLALSARYYRRGILLRTFCALTFLLLLLNPSVTTEQRTPVPDVAVVIADHSPSQDIGRRRARTDAALAYLQERIRALPGLELRVIDSASGETGPPRETLLFDKIDQALADVPAARRAGVVLLTDGQVHDVPQEARRFHDYGPVNVLLSGEHHERDRQLNILEGPSYGIVGQEVQVRYHVEDPAAPAGDTVTMFIRQDNVPPQTVEVPVNTDQALTVKVAHAGQNIVDLEASAAPGELTFANNRAPLIVNGVRDRLRVLLISGQPYAGGRTWRNLLTSDPGVDLVHFTIMRQPDKFDPTPQNDMSLIAFPFDELFQTKLYSFDLIIFDRYKLNRILPDYYFSNIAKYVKDGGALLVTDGPSAATGNSLYTTALAEVLSAPPTGQLIDQPFQPAITETGRRHPVTQGLTWPGGVDGAPGWGAWLRQVAVTPAPDDEVVMSGANKLPLLILSRVGKGRVAQLASDEIWLWSRDYAGGGPQGELLRRLAHWLMKEPELEENALDVTADGSGLLIRRHALTTEPMTVTITAPDGVKSAATVTPSADGILEAHVPATKLGVYVVNDGTQERFALMGALNPPELTGVRTTPERLAPMVQASGGAINWLADNARPDVLSLAAGRRAYGGAGWLAFRNNDSYIVTGSDSRPLLPVWLYVAGLFALLLAAWWFEGRGRTFETS